ncbi:MAG: hypothetical protein RI894_165 [Bacteroidota bacterium]|jgi:pantothenate kinase type III
MNKIVLFFLVIMLGASSCKFFQHEEPQAAVADSTKIKADAKMKADSLAALAKQKTAAPAHKAAAHHGKKHH